jgi:hypothetical protein
LTAVQTTLYAAFDAHPNLALGTEIDTVDTDLASFSFDYQMNDVPPATGEANYHAVASYSGDFYIFVHRDPVSTARRLNHHGRPNDWVQLVGRRFVKLSIGHLAVLWAA